MTRHPAASHISIKADGLPAPVVTISTFSSAQIFADASAEGDEQLVAWLEELKAYRASDRFGNEIEESVGKCPTMREAQKIFKRNGYQLVSQRGSHQKWVKEGDRIPIILPYHSRDNEQVRPGDWKTIVKEHNLRLDV